MEKKHRKTTRKTMTAEQKRKARNEYSRKWKKAHAADVRRWNQAWRKAQAKVAAKKRGKPVRKAPVVKAKAPQVHAPQAA